MGGHPCFSLLCSGRIKLTFKKLFQRRNLLKFGAVLPQYLLFFIIQPLTVRPYKATAWLVYRVGGGLYAHIPLSISCFLPFLFLLFIGYNCLVTLVVKSNHYGD